MERREQVAREQAVISMTIAISLRCKLHAPSYARIGRRRSTEKELDLMERVALDELAKECAGRLAAFAFYDGDQVHHWPVAVPVVRQALVDIPMELRAALVPRDKQDAPAEIARRIFAASDARYRLVPLPGHPGPHTTWANIFVDEFGAGTAVCSTLPR